MSRFAGRPFVAARVQQLADNVPGYVAVGEVEIRGRDGRFSQPLPYKLDTGASHSVISEDQARLLGFDLTGEPDGEVRGTAGAVAAWRQPRFVHFPGLPDWQFRVWFFVPVGDRPVHPLLGLRDIHLNFDVVIRGGEVFFHLTDGHTGERYLPSA